MTSTRIAPPASVVLLEDVNGGQIPESMRGSLIVSTNSCIAIGCRAEIDGETKITLGTAREVDPGRPPAFEGQLKTPSGKIVVRTTLNRIILDAPVLSPQTKIRVWVSDPREPDDVVIGIVAQDTSDSSTSE